MLKLVQTDREFIYSKANSIAFFTFDFLKEVFLGSGETKVIRRGSASSLTNGGTTCDGSAKRFTKRRRNNASRSTNSQLHASEETELVNKILGLAGIVINKPDLAQAGAALDNAKLSQEKQ